MAKSGKKLSFWRELGKLNLYKRNQGRLTRQLSWVGMMLLVLFGVWTLSQGWLSTFVNSYYSVEVRYTAAEPDNTLDESLDQLVREKKYDGYWGAARFDGQSRVISFRFPTSQFYETDTELQAQAGERARQFQQAVEKQYPQVTVQAPRHAVREVFWIKRGVPLLLAVLGAWILFRLVNYPQFADFLISVEAEMDKVSWASKKELQRATVVVVCTMFFLGAVLAIYDWIWFLLFRAAGILQL